MDDDLIIAHPYPAPMQVNRAAMSSWGVLEVVRRTSARASAGARPAARRRCRASMTGVVSASGIGRRRNQRGGAKSKHRGGHARQFIARQYTSQPGVAGGQHEYPRCAV